MIIFKSSLPYKYILQQKRQNLNSLLLTKTQLNTEKRKYIKKKTNYKAVKKKKVLNHNEKSIVTSEIDSPWNNWKANHQAYTVQFIVNERKVTHTLHWMSYVTQYCTEKHTETLYTDLSTTKCLLSETQQ